KISVTRPAPAKLDADFAPFGPTQLLQSCSERRNPRLSYRVVRAEPHENTDLAHAVGLLRARHQRRTRGTNNQSNGIPPIHATTHTEQRHTISVLDPCGAGSCCG